MEGKLIVTSSPHLRSGVTTRQIMLDVLISLVPCVVAATWIFGFRALLVIVFCAAVCVLLEFICRLVMKREQTIGDLSAAVSGVLLALTLPPSIGLAQALVGCAVAIVVVKQMFGGIGCNFVNPALTARIVMLLSFPTQMTTWTLADGTTTATPLGGAEAGLKELFFGTVGGSMGETCAAAILLGFVYLLARRVIPDTVRIPAFITVIAGFVTIVQMLVKAYAPEIDKSLGIFLPLIVVNCIILGRAEMFASKNGVLASALDGLGMGVGFTAAMLVMGMIRELVGTGCLFGMQVLPGSVYVPITIFILPAGGFFVFGILIAIAQRLRKGGDKKQADGCEGCPMAAACREKREKDA